MPPAIRVGQGSPIDPTWITAGSQVLGAALKPAAAGGPSRSDSGGYFDFGDSPFIVNTGSGSASSSATGSMLWALVAAGIGLIAWKLAKKT